MNQYEIENSKILDNLLYKLFNISHDGELELNITPQCNQKCSYCYLYKYGDKLYPSALQDSKTIINNTKLLLNYVDQKGYKFRCISLFAGEIWETDLAKSILEILYTSLSKNKFSSNVCIPSNMYFLHDPEVIAYYDDLISKFHNIGVRLFFSASIDGKYLDNDNRSRKNNSKYTNEFYDTVFEFCSKHGFGFHPMVAAANIDKWIDNFNWYMDQFKKFNIGTGRLMMLEVRNDDWTDESITSLIKFLDYEIDWLITNVFNNDPIEFAKHLAVRQLQLPYVPDNLMLNDKLNRYTCSIQHTLMVRIGDLSIIPCHRTSYEQFIYGKFIVEDDKITGIKAEHAELAAKIYLTNPEVANIVCANCKYKRVCNRGCLGSQFETNNNLFIPCESVCKMLKTKIDFLANKYYQLGILDKVSDMNIMEELYEF